MDAFLCQEGDEETKIRTVTVNRINREAALYSQVLDKEVKTVGQFSGFQGGGGVERIEKSLPLV